MAASSLSIAPPKHLEKGGNLSENWRQWKQNFVIYLGAAGISATDPKACPLFLHSIGQYGRDIFNELDISLPHSLIEFYEKFDQHCNPKRNLTFDRYTFFNTKQESKQSFDKFYALLKQISLNCEFGDLTNSLIGTQIIIGINNAPLRKRLLTMADLTLNDIVEECKSSEIARLQAQKIEAALGTSATKQKTYKTPAANVNPIEKLSQDLHASLQALDKKVINAKEKKNEKQTENSKEKLSEHRKEKPDVIQHCKFCSGTHKYGNCPNKTKDDASILCGKCGKSHKKGACPAKGSTCHKCKKPDHFIKMCKA